MKLIIALGNPGKEYANTRHNAGWIVADEIARELSFPEFQFNKKFNAEISENNTDGEKVILAKPQTFMNLSGQSVLAIANFYKIQTDDIIILHDELDIELGKFKISTDSSAAGHNGVASIFEILGTQKIKRVRIGIEGAEKKRQRLASGKDFVLENFSPEELEIVKKLAGEIMKNL